MKQEEQPRTSPTTNDTPLQIGGVRQSIGQILSRFKNGVELYETNAFFGSMVEGLYRGTDPYIYIPRTFNRT